MHKKVDVKTAGFLIFVFLNTPILFSLNSVYWDDWILFNTEFEVLYQRFSEAGAIFNWVSYFHYGMINFAGPWAYKLTVFLAILVNAGLFVRVLRLYGFLRSELIITFLLIIILPLFGSRYAAINVFYSLAVSLFLTAWLIHFRFKIISYVFFFFSFSMGSLIFCFPVFLVLEAIRLRSNFNHFGKIMHFIVLIFLPIFYFLVKTQYYSPYGAYSQYQIISASNILPSLGRVPQVTEWTVLEMMAKSNILDWVVSFVIVILAAAFFNFSFRGVDFDRSANTRLVWSLSGLGCASLLSILPYSLIGNELNFFYGFESRNQALLIFPLAAFISVTLNFLLSRRMSRVTGKILLIFILSMGSFVQFLIYVSYMNDHFKTEKIINALRVADIQIDQFNFVFQDFSEIAFTEQRLLSSYEYSGIMRYALGRDAIFARDETYWNGDVCFKNYPASALYNNQGFDLRTNNDITRLTIKTEGGMHFPVIGLHGYDLYVEQEPGLAWCQDVCADCGFVMSK